MKEYEKPWQVLPAKIVQLANEHASKNTDFDHQLAFLLLDVGVETALKVYLINKKLDVEKIYFSDLIKKVKEELAKENLDAELDDVEYFHKVRNKLYHQGDGVKPTSENLHRYSELASKLLKILINVDIFQIESEDTKPKYSILNEDQHYTYTIEDAAKELSTRLRYFHESCALIVEHLHPSFATRKFALELQKVWEDTRGQMYTDDSSFQTVEEAVVLTNFTEERLRQFDEVAKKYIEPQDIMRFGFDVASDVYNESDRDFVDSILANVNHLYVWLVLQYFENSNDEWEKYQHFAGKISILPERWILGLDESQISFEVVTQEYKELKSWIVPHQNTLDKWVTHNMPDFQRPDMDLFFPSGKLHFDW